MKLPIKTGLKLYSTNISLIPEIKSLHEGGFFDYIELYVIPGSFNETSLKWKALNVKYIIHAPHSFHDVNFAQAEKRETNLLHFRETQKFADILNSDIIIVHGGNNGSFDETINQLTMLNDDRIILENKPKMGIHGEICVGYSPAEFQAAADAGFLNGTVLDFGHAVYASNSSGIEAMDMIRELMEFNPKVFHLSDGDADSEKDVHYNLGKGNFNLSEFLSVVPDGGCLTLETPRRKTESLKDFMEDVDCLRKLLNESTGGNT